MLSVPGWRPGAAAMRASTPLPSALSVVVQGWKLRGVVYQPPLQVRRAGGTAAKASADIRQKCDCCV
nr:MAG TPA_asm: hypothetical protein [Caudoviricetes sp.]